MHDAFEIQSDVLPESTRLLAFRGHEAISEPFSFVVDVFIDAEDVVDLDAAVGGRATITSATTAAGAEYDIHGLIIRVAHMHEANGRAVYQLHLAPSFWALSQSHHSRVFTNKTVPEIIEAVLSEAGLTSFELALQGSYPTREHVCQYHESDFDFVSRWMEREGMYYYFDHSGDDDKLVIADHLSNHDKSREKAVRYRALSAQDTSSGEAFYRFRSASVLLPGSVKLTDYNYLTPDVDVLGENAVLAKGQALVVDHGVNVDTPGEGVRVAQVRAEELLATKSRYRGRGQVINVRSGYKFDVDEHPRGDFNREYLCVRVEHFANQSGDPHWRKVLDIPFDDEYRVEVEAIASDRQFRAERRTPWPRIYGVESGVIDGPATSEYAQIDEHGRYHVKINFDEGPGAGDTSSTWIRMAQPHGGDTEGFHFPLRKDTEVMLSFLGGDPDRPIISAVLPNATKPSPVTSSNNTQNVIQTGGRNLIEIEDQDGVQYIDVSTPTQDTFLRMGEPRADHHIDLSTQGDGHLYTGGDLDVEVMGDKTEHVVGDVTEDYDSNQDSTIGIDKTTTVVANHTMDVGGNQDITVTGDQTVTVLGTQTVNVTADQTEVFTANKNVAITADATATIGGNSASCTIGTAASVTIGAFSSVKLAAEMNFTGGNYVGVTVGSFFNTTIGNSASLKVAMDDSVTIGVTNAAYIGIKNSLYVGGKNDITVAAIIDISLAAKLSISAALKAEFVAAVGLEYKATKVKDNAVNSESAKVRQLEATVSMLTAKTNVLSNQILLLAN